MTTVKRITVTRFLSDLETANADTSHVGSKIAEAAYKSAREWLLVEKTRKPRHPDYLRTQRAAVKYGKLRTVKFADAPID